MHTGHRYTIKQVFFWTRRERYLFLLIAALPSVVLIPAPSMPW